MAFDAGGHEVGRARQWINRPRAFAEAGFVLDTGTGGRGRMARLVWQCVYREEPLSLAVTFDGQPIRVSDPQRIALPPFVPEQLHVLRAELDFGGGIAAAAELFFGGTRNAEALTDLTPVPVVLGKGTKFDGPEWLEGWLAAGGRPVDVVAIEEGPAEVIFVLAGCVREDLQRIRSGWYFKKDEKLNQEWTFRFAWPLPDFVEMSKGASLLFHMTTDFVGGMQSVLRLTAAQRGPEGLEGQQIGEAVCVAAIHAAARERRRAVVLVLGSGAEDLGDVSLVDAIGFLERLRVPLFVWSAALSPPPPAGLFREFKDASTRPGYEDALREVRLQVEAQRIVWVRGTFLPHQVELTDLATGLALAR